MQEEHRVRLRLIAIVLIGLLSFANPAQPSWLNGELQSDYYHYQDDGQNDRFVFTQSLSGRVMPRTWRGWKADFRAELRDANDPIPGGGDGRVLGLALSGRMGALETKLGRIVPRAGGFGVLDGLELSTPVKDIRATLAGGREFYSLYRMESADLPERYRAAAQVEGRVGKFRWTMDHTARFRSGEIDDQVTTIALRCRRLERLGGDLRAGYDEKASNLRDFAAGLVIKPRPDAMLNIHYSERRYRVYQESLFSRFEIEPTRLAGVTARYRLSGREHPPFSLPQAGGNSDDLWLGFGYTRRLREEGDLDRLFASVANDWGEAGIRFQLGDNLGQVGGWLNATGSILPRLSWGASMAFDRWDSAWDAEPTEEWANSLSLNYELSPVADVAGRVEQFRTGALDNDVRALLTFKMRYGL